MSDDVLLKQCEIDTYRASGPGGQKRNKTSSAVRLRHRPSGLIVIAEESRSQHENKAKALRRLRRAFVLERRETVTLTAEAIAELPDWASALSNDGRVHLGAKDPRFWPAIGIALDVLNGVDARISDAASLLGISTGHLNELFAKDPKVWQHVNILRARFGQKPLRSST